MKQKNYFIIFWILLGISLVFAGITVSEGGTSFDSVNESINTLYNITIENLNTTEPENWTEVNITLPGGFVFILDSNDTDAGTHTFSNTSTILTWSNDGLVMNLTNQSFWFNATSSSIPGSYNFTITAFNDSAIVETQNLSVVVNDTIEPSLISFVNPGLTLDTVNASQTNIPINISVTDLGIVDTITIKLYNSTQDEINSSVNSSNVNSWFYNFTGLNEGIYYVNATANDTFNNENSSITLNITLDITAPIVTHSCVSTDVTTADTMSCSCSGTDSGSGVATISYTESPSTDSAGTFTTSCIVTDYAGNSYQSNISYTVNLASGSSGTISYTWDKTYVPSKEELIIGYTTKLKKDERIKARIGTLFHYIGLIDLTSTTATISVFSEPQEVVLNIRDEKKFDVNNDNYYDLSVQLNSIENNKANLTIKSIYEEISQEIIEEETIEEKIKEDIKEIEETKEGRNLIWFLIIIGIVVIGILIGLSYKKRKGKINLSS